MRALLLLLLLACLPLARAEESSGIEPGSYLLNPVGAAAIPFTLTQSGDDWELRSEDPTFPLRRVHCAVNADVLAARFRVPMVRRSPSR